MACFVLWNAFILFYSTEVCDGQIVYGKYFYDRFKRDWTGLWLILADTTSIIIILLAKDASVIALHHLFSFFAVKYKNKWIREQETV